MPWRPGQRAAQRALEAPFEDVPDHLAQPLWSWIEEGFTDPLTGPQFGRMRSIALMLRMTLPAGSGRDQLNTYLRYCQDGTRDGMLNVIEAMLERYGTDRGRANSLDAFLEAGNSIYRVNEDDNGLEMRVAPGVRELVQETVNAAGGSAGDHLSQAWNEAYGRIHDPVKSYSESIKAAEAAMAAHVTPQNPKQTLGTMIADVSAKPSKWEFEIADGNVSNVETVLRMMQTLWTGQTSRHGAATTRPETIEEARAAVHIAAALVQFGTNGAFRLK